LALIENDIPRLYLYDLGGNQIGNNGCQFLG
jgi:hypothetical protein